MSDYSDAYDRPLWYAAYTASRHEKQVSRHLQDRGLDHLLPLYASIHRWKNGRHLVEEPLFPGYVFVHIQLGSRMRVLEVPGVVHLVGFGNRPYPVPEEEIRVVRAAMLDPLRVLPHPYLTTGSRVEICVGPLQGFQGILLRRSGKCRVVLSVDLIMRSVVVETDIDNLRRLPESVSCPQLTTPAGTSKNYAPPLHLARAV